MVKIKKLFAVVMAVVMLASCFVVAASAYTYAPSMTTGTVVITATADKTTVAPGDVVTITMCIDPGANTDLSAFGNVIVYNSAQLTPVGTTIQTFRTWLGDFANVGNPNASGNMNYAASTQLTAFTTEEKAYFDKGIMILGSMSSSASRWNPVAGEGYMSFQMTVSDSVSAGDEIWVGTHEAAFTRGTSYFTVNAKRLATTEYDVTNSMVKLTVASDEPSLTVENNKNQIRYGKNSRGEYAGQVDIRNVAKIAATEFEAIDVSRITEAGFVYAPSTTTFSAETAQAVAKGTAADGYAKATVGTIYDEGDYYTFSCLVYGIDDADIATAAYNCYAYIAVDGEYWFFYADAVAISALSLYNTHLANANTAYGWTLAAK